MDGFHELSMAEDEGDVSFMAEIGKPVPAKCGFAGDDERVSIRSEGEFEFIDSALEFPMEQFVALMIEHAEIKCSGMKVNACIECVGVLVESYHRLLCEVVECARSAVRTESLSDLL